MAFNTGKRDREWMEHPPPRPLSLWLLLALIRRYLKKRPYREFVDLPLLSGMVGTGIMAAVRARRVRIIPPLAMTLLRLLWLGIKVGHTAYHDFMLLRYGTLATAHITGIHLHYDANRTLRGAYLDCIVQVDQRRISASSIWFDDIHQAAWLKKQGTITALCLPRAPGTCCLLMPTELSAVPHQKSANQSRVPPGHDHQ